MIGKLHPSQRGDALSPTDPRLLDRPLDFMAEDHQREREVCAMLDRIALAERPDAGDLAMAAAFLQDELPLHLADEEEDLFPLMLRRCTPDDEIARVIGRLRTDHDHAGAETPDIIRVLARLRSDPGPASDDDRAALATYARHGRRHLIVENAIILPLARVRLTAADLETLGLRMRQRRRGDQSPETRSAE